MRLALAVPAPGVEGVVHDHAVPEHLMVVREVGGQAEGNGEQPCRLRRQIQPGCVGTPNNGRQLMKCWIIEAVLGQESVKAAQVADVTESLFVDVRR